MHWIKKRTLDTGVENYYCPFSVERETLILSALHIKLGIKKQFIKSLV